MRYLKVLLHVPKINTQPQNSQAEGLETIKEKNNTETPAKRTTKHRIELWTSRLTVERSNQLSYSVLWIITQFKIYIYSIFFELSLFPLRDMVYVHMSQL